MSNVKEVDINEIFSDAFGDSINRSKDILHSGTHEGLNYLLPVCLQQGKKIYSIPITNVYYRPRKKMYYFEFMRTGNHFIRICCSGIDNHGNWDIIMEANPKDWQKFHVASEENMTLEKILKKYIFKF